MFNPMTNITVDRWHRVSIGNPLWCAKIWLMPYHKTGSWMRWIPSDFIYNPRVWLTSKKVVPALEVTYTEADAGEYLFRVAREDGTFLKNVWVTHVADRKAAAEAIAKQEGGYCKPWTWT